MKMMELLLKKDIPKLGNKGSIVKVKSGFARNYLIPNDLATKASKENIRLLEIEKKKLLQLELAKKEEIKTVAQELELTACTIEAKANEEGHLFGSVTYSKIAENFQKMGFNVKAEDMELEDPTLYPIKELGIFAVHITLHPEITAKSKVWVVNEQEEA